MTTAKNILTLAAKEIGTKESPAGSNRVKYAAEYGMNGQAWCLMFVWWVFKQAGASPLFFGGKKSAYTPTCANYYKQQGQWHSTPKVGDMVFFANATRICHVGLVEKVISADTIQTIEGNTALDNDANGGMVMRRLRGIKGTKSWHVAGFARPAYASLPTASKPASVVKTDPAPTYNLLKVLKVGSIGSAVKKLQTELNVRKFTDAKNRKLVVDGIFGKGTQQAVMKLQTSKGIAADGQVGAKTAKVLGWSFGVPQPTVKKYVLTRVLEKGLRGNDVKALQKRLKELKITDGKGRELITDGDFGENTKKAVAKFQAKRGLAVDSRVGKVTAKALGWDYK